MKTFALLAGKTNGQLRTGQFYGTEHLVVPIVALVEGVLHASNSPTPELVLSSEFSKTPQGWNGRPVMMDHPEINGNKVSANDPTVLEKFGLGHVFAASIKDGKLMMEAWINLSRSAAVPNSEELIARLRAGTAVEVSVGVFINTDKKNGIFNGRRYSAIWRDIVPDHLALLPAGTIGACSVEMGCGAPRAATGQEGEDVAKSFFVDFLKRFRPATEENSEEQQKIDNLDTLLRSLETNFLWVENLDQAKKMVIYSCAPGNVKETYERSYTDEGGALSVADDRKEVKSITTYEPVVASAAPPTEPVVTAAKTECGCTKPAPVAAEGENSMKNKIRVAAALAVLKAQIKSPVLQVAMSRLTDADIAAIEASDEQTVALEAQAKEFTEQPAAPVVAAAAPVVVPAKPKTDEEFLAEHPAIQEIVTAHAAAQDARKTELVTKLKTSQTIHDEAKLKTMSVSELDGIFALLENVKPKHDYSGAGGPRAPRSEENTPPAPRKFTDAVKAANKAH